MGQAFLKQTIMKTSKTAMIMIAASALCLYACGNTAARENRKKSDDRPKGVVELTSETFNTTICDIKDADASFLGDKPAIVDFTATWCGPCRKLSPVLEELAVEYKGKVDFYKIDVDKCRDIAEAFRISSIPALLFIPKDGTPRMLVGFRDKETMRQDIEGILLK